MNNIICDLRKFFVKNTLILIKHLLKDQEVYQVNILFYICYI